MKLILEIKDEEIIEDCKDCNPDIIMEDLEFGRLLRHCELVEIIK